MLLKGAAAGMEELSRRCVEAVRERYAAYAPEADWYVAVGRPTQRLSTLPACFEEVSRLWAYRYVTPRQHVLTADTVSLLTGTGGEKCLDRLDADRADPAILDGAMGSISAQEVPRFVEEYVRGVEEALSSRAFCQYLMLSARFAAVRFPAPARTAAKRPAHPRNRHPNAAPIPHLTNGQKSVRIGPVPFLKRGKT